MDLVHDYIRRLKVTYRSVARLCRTLCNPKDTCTAGFSVHHQLPEFVQTHVLWVGDAIQPSHPLSPPSPPALNLSQHQGFFLMSWFFTSGGPSISKVSAKNVSPYYMDILIIRRKKCICKSFSFRHYIYLIASLVAQMVENLHTIWETPVQSLDKKDLLEKGMTTHSSILAWRIPWTEEPGTVWSQAGKENYACVPVTMAMWQTTPNLVV